jgi:hypothetical protein
MPGLIIQKHYRMAAAVLMLMLPSAVFAANATMREYPTLYKSPRAMGMGGAYTAIGGRADSLFYNPAGLANMPRDKGWEVNLLNLSAELGKDAKNFFRDIQNANDTPDLNGDGKTDDDQQKAVNEVLSNYRGQNLHVAAADFTSIGKNYESFAFAVGTLANVRIDADATYGGIAGFSYPFTKQLDLGLSIKSLHRESVIKKITAREIVENQDNMDNYITEELRKKGGAVGIDAGALYKFAPDSWWRPSAGVSVMNIGDLDFKQAGKVPMTVNAGFALHPNISWSRSWIIGVDYIDLLNSFPQDTDMIKRIRMGTELQLFDILPVEMSVRLGLYDGYPTYGADIRLLTFLFSYTMYTAEVGAYAGQSKDTRQLFSFNFGW